MPFELDAAQCRLAPPRRLAIVVTHPIQYLSPVFRRLSQIPDVQIRVFFGSRIGLTQYKDPGFGVELSWDCDLISGFPHEFLPGSAGVRALNWCSLAQVQIWDALERYDPDAVLLHGYAHPLVLRAWRWSKARGRRAMLFGDGNGKTVGREGAVRTRLKRAVLRPLIGSTHRILTLGECNEAYWRHRGAVESQLLWAPMLLAMPEVKPENHDDYLAKRCSFRRKLGIHDDQVVTLYCGKFQAFKRVIDLVNAVDRCAQVVGVYVGDGSELSRCKDEARTERHRFLGFGNVSQLSACYAGADVLCHPSSRENYGLVIAEAAACGLPIIATSIVGAIGQRSHGRVGRNAEIYDSGDVDALTGLVRALAEDRLLRDRMGVESIRISDEMERACFDGVRIALADRV